MPDEKILPPAESVRHQLDRLLASRVFQASERHSRFLRFTIEETLQGRGDGLKEYVLAVNVFNRRDSFDPRSDAIVRVEASRIREKLRGYYRAEGRGDPVLVEYPRGSYVPAFKRQDLVPAPTVDIPKTQTTLFRNRKRTGRLALSVLLALGLGMAVYWALAHSSRQGLPSERQSSRRPALIAVLPFVNLGGEKEAEYFADGLTEELIIELARVRGLRVVARTSALQFKGKPEDIRQIGARLKVDAILDGTIRIAGGRLRVNAELVDVANGYDLSSARHEAEYKEPLRLQGEIAHKILQELGILSMK